MRHASSHHYYHVQQNNRQSYYIPGLTCVRLNGKEVLVSRDCDLLAGESTTSIFRV
jgi:hypothetical protein